MVLTGLTKHLVTAFTSVLLLLCQTAAMAQACTLATVSAGDSALVEPCHDGAHPSGDAPAHAQPHGCAAQYASSSAVKIDPLQPLDLPALEVQMRPLASPAGYEQLAAAPAVRAQPPPLTILHCRLRI